MGNVETFESLEDFNACLQQYEGDTNTKFIVLKSDRAFGRNDLTVEKQLQWEVKIVHFNGMPFKIIGKKTYICHQGRDKHAKAKQRRQESNPQGHEYACLKTRRLMQPTKKMGCPATINVVHIVRFPEYKITEDNSYQKREKSSAVREALRLDPKRVRTEEMFAASFPDVKEHQNHPVFGKALVNTWKEEGCAVEYRPSQEEEEEDGSVVKMLLCLQTPWQKRLMRLYGQQMCLLDESYRAGRYVELNIKCSSGSRKYSTNVPCYAGHSPRIMSQHIIKRHQESLPFNASDITSAGENVFNVQSQTSLEKHQVNFGKDDEMPSCTCTDWQRHLLPCQHFCAVFALVPGWSWENLSAAYRKNPLFTFDEVCLGQSATLPADLQGEEALKKNQEKDSSPERCPSPAPSEPILTNPEAEKSEKCCSLLKEISELTCHIQDGTFLDSVTDRLTDLLKDIRRHTPHDDILDLSYAPPSKKMCSASAEHPESINTVPLYLEKIMRATHTSEF
ncbi:hypothetical protein cypCar_00036719 [Cyprinus carpio]|nr:hypothetical protein cypCar_00036719 [Cyprinus carpio]